MVRVLVAFGMLIFALVLGLGMWHMANRQLAEAWTQCEVELNVQERVGAAISGAELTRLLAETVECADRRKGALASLFFGRDALLDRYAQKLRRSAALQAEAEERYRKEYEEEMQDRQDAINDYEAEYNLQQFREGVYRGADKP